MRLVAHGHRASKRKGALRRFVADSGIRSPRNVALLDFRQRDQQDVFGCLGDETFGDASEQRPSQPAVTPRPHQQRRRLVFGLRIEDLPGRVTPANVDPCTDPPLLEQFGEHLELVGEHLEPFGRIHSSESGFFGVRTWTSVASRMS